MLNAELQAATNRLVSRLTALFAAELDRLQRPPGMSQLAEAALKVVESSGPMTPDELRARLNAALAPVIDRLVEAGESRSARRVDPRQRGRVACARTAQELEE